jgi:hypothetical protein
MLMLEVKVSTRPTEVWREAIKEEAQLVAAGLLEEDFAVTASLFPRDLLTRFDAVLETFEQDVMAHRDGSDETILNCVRNMVFALNSLDHDYGGEAITTSERDLLCAYLDEVLTEVGLDVGAICRRRGVSRGELADEWRTW